MRIVNLTKETTANILENMLKRSPNNYGQYESTVNEIIRRVKGEGDKAVFEYTLNFDKFALTPQNIKVTREEIEEAYREVEPSLLDVIRKSLVNIRSYHEKQKKYSWFDTTENGTIRRYPQSPQRARRSVQAQSSRSA